MFRISEKKVGLFFYLILYRNTFHEPRKKNKKKPLRKQGKSGQLFYNLYENDNIIFETRQLISCEKMNTEKLGYQPKKNMSVYFAKLFRQAGLEKQSANVFYCSKDICTNENFKVKTISSCRTRLCPVCSWRLSIKTYKVLYRIMLEITKKYNKDFVFITLTVQNCNSEELSKTIDMLMAAYKKLYQRKEFKNAFDGLVRALEVTYNAVENTYHPHFHVLAHCRQNYFSKAKDLYISHEKLRMLWKECYKTEYKPFVNIQAFKNGTAEELKKSIAEVAKYCVKGTDITNNKLPMEKQAETLGTLFCALDGRRLLSYQGIFKEIKKELSLDEHDFTDVDETDITEAERIFTYVYDERKYFEVVDDDYLP